MKVYRKREVIEEVEIDDDEAEDLVETVILNGGGEVISVVRDIVVDAWREKEW